MKTTSRLPHLSLLWAIILAALCLTLVAAPAAEAKLKRCPGASVKRPNKLEFADFRVKGTTCATAVRIMRRFPQNVQKAKISGWTISVPVGELTYRGKRKHALFTCLYRVAQSRTS